MVAKGARSRPRAGKSLANSHRRRPIQRAQERPLVRWPAEGTLGLQWLLIRWPAASRCSPAKAPLFFALECIRWGGAEAQFPLN